MQVPSAEAAQVIAALYASHGPDLVRYLQRLTGHYETAQDLAQETFLKALRSWGQLLATDADGVRAWLFRIATTTAYDEFRRRRRRPTTPLSEMHLNTLMEATGPLIEEREALFAILDQLPECWRVPLLLQGYYGLPLHVIAARLGWKEGTLKSRLHRARKAFQRLYAAAEGPGQASSGRNYMRVPRAPE